MPLSYAQKLGFHSVCSIFEDFNSIRCENLRSVRYFCPQTVNFATNVAGTPNSKSIRALEKLQMLASAEDDFIHPERSAVLNPYRLYGMTKENYSRLMSESAMKVP